MVMIPIPKRECFFLISLLTSTAASASGGRPALRISSIPNIIQEISRRGHSAVTRSVPALSVHNVKDEELSSSKHGGRKHQHKTLEVAVKRRRNKKRKLPPLPKLDVPTEIIQEGGFYYGITPATLKKASTHQKRQRLSDSMEEALGELRIMRKEMETMRKEMQTMKRKMVADGDMEEDSEEMKSKQIIFKRRQARDSEKLAREIEGWAQQLLKETEDDGWKEVACNKMMRKSVNPTGRTVAYVKWMKDSRGDKADQNDDNEYPCIKCVSTIDAPLEDVCTYLSEENASPDYNDLVVKHKDIEEISPNAKICWSQSPQILFLKPRDFVTFCSHRWKRDGAEVIVNQAWDHKEFPAVVEEKAGKACRAYALRGANFFSRSPEDPEKTKIEIVAHANPGGGVPAWAAKTAVNALVPIEPFKLFHKINVSVSKNQPKLRERLQEQAEMVRSLPGGRSSRPAGMAQLGYACFWPKGGGVEEGATQKPQLNTDEEERNTQGHSRNNEDPANLSESAAVGSFAESS